MHVLKHGQIFKLTQFCWMLNHHVTRYCVTSRIQPSEIQLIKKTVKSFLLCYGCKDRSRLNWKIPQTKNRASLSGGRFSNDVFIKDETIVVGNNQLTTVTGENGIYYETSC